MSQAGRISAWAAEASITPRGYEATFFAMADNAGIGPGNFNERLTLYLQAITATAITSLPGLQAETAIQLGHSSWNEVGSDITSLAGEGWFLESGFWAAGGQWTGSGIWPA